MASYLEVEIRRMCPAEPEALFDIRPSKMGKWYKMTARPRALAMPLRCRSRLKTSGCAFVRKISQLVGVWDALNCVPCPLSFLTRNKKKMAFASVLADADVKAALAGCSGEFALTFRDFFSPSHSHFSGGYKAKTTRHSKES